MSATTESICHGCGFRAPPDAGTWQIAEHPTLGQLTRCPECGSTDIHDQTSGPA